MVRVPVVASGRLAIFEQTAHWSLTPTTRQDYQSLGAALTDPYTTDSAFCVAQHPQYGKCIKLIHAEGDHMSRELNTWPQLGQETYREWVDKLVDSIEANLTVQDDETFARQLLGWREGGS